MKRLLFLFTFFILFLILESFSNYTPPLSNREKCSQSSFKSRVYIDDVVLNRKYKKYYCFSSEAKALENLNDVLGEVSYIVLKENWKPWTQAHSGPCVDASTNDNNIDPAGCLHRNSVVTELFKLTDRQKKRGSFNDSRTYQYGPSLLKVDVCYCDGNGNPQPNTLFGWINNHSEEDNGGIPIPKTPQCN